MPATIWMRCSPSTTAPKYPKLRAVRLFPRKFFKLLYMDGAPSAAGIQRLEWKKKLDKLMTNIWMADKNSLIFKRTFWYDIGKLLWKEHTTLYKRNICAVPSKPHPADWNEVKNIFHKENKTLKRQRCKIQNHTPKNSWRLPRKSHSKKEFCKLQKNLTCWIAILTAAPDDSKVTITMCKTKSKSKDQSTWPHS